VRNVSFRLPILTLAFGIAACTSVTVETPIGVGGAGGQGGESAGGGTVGSGGVSSTGGVSATGGVEATGGTKASGGTTSKGGSGGAAGSGGSAGSGGAAGSGGSAGSGGAAGSGGSAGRGGSGGSGGAAGSGGTSNPGSGGKTNPGTGGTSNPGSGGRTNPGTGGVTIPGTGGATNPGVGGRTGTGGTTGGATGGSTGTLPVFDCNTPMPTSGGQSHSGNSSGGSGNLAWQIWSNQGTGTLTTFANTAAFTSGWNNSGNYLGRLGFEWGSGGKSYDQYGTITAQFTETKSGSSGGAWSYIGIYGWTNNPCIEWYIIDDSYSKMPINPGSCANMSNSPLSIDDGKYTMCVRNTSGTGGDRCGGAGSWNQYYSIRQSNRTCGTISVTEHFKAWTAAGNKLGNMLEVKILLEVGGGQGSVDFPVANVMKTQ
jgi:endo-1,4-beta-xylanase